MTIRKFSAPQIEAPESQRQILEELARQLLAHHVRVSVPHDIREKLPKSPLIDEASEPTRIVVLVGAGASASVVGSSDDLLKSLSGDEDKSYREYLKWLTTVYRVEEDTFETHLLALSRTPVHAERVRKSLQDKCSVRHPTLLCYEIIAHLMKYRFVDAVISLNFDELLDQSIEDELGKGEYLHIVSERDCHTNNGMPEDHKYKPLYIKLHGTASDPETLRFTREAYSARRDAISSTIKDLLSGSRCTLLNVGTSLSSFELYSLLSEPESLAVFTFGRNELPLKAKEEISRVRKNETTFKNIFTNSGWKSNPESEERGLLLHGLCDFLDQLAKENAGLVHFRSIERHLLICELLRVERNVSLTGDNVKYAEYLRRRAILEGAFTAVKKRGLVPTESLVRNPIAHYFDEYEACVRAAGREPESWTLMCKNAGLVTSIDSQETLVADPDLCEPPCQTAAPEEDRRYDRSKLAAHVWKSLRFHDPRRADLAITQIKDTFEILLKDTDVDIHAWDDSICSKVFKRPKVLNTLTALDARTIEVFEGADYDTIGLVTESGGWLVKEPFLSTLKNSIAQGRLKRLYVVLARTQGEELRTAFGDVVKIKFRDWRNHNRHMTITFKADSPRKAIYFARRLLAAFVTPVYLDHEDDLEFLNGMLIRYWNTATETRGTARPPLPKRLDDL